MGGMVEHVFRGGQAQDPGVAAAALDPGTRLLVPALAGGDAPLTEHGRVPAVEQEAGHALDHRPGDPAARVPEQPALVRRDDERRIGDDEVEALALAGVAGVAVAELDVFDPAQGERPPGEPQGAGVEIDADDAVGVARRERGLRAGPRAQVEGTSGRTADGEIGQRLGHARGADDMVVRRRAVVPVVRDERAPPGLDGDGRPNRVAVPLHQLDALRVERARVDLLVEEEQPGQGGEPVVPDAPALD